MSAGEAPAEGAARARRDEVLGALVEAGEAGVSGEVLAERLGCSRAAVHRHVEAIRRAGTPVVGLAGGYRLGPEADPVVPALVAPRLAPPLAGPLEWLPTTGSTNDDVLARARDGAPEGLVIGADHQGAGRGRRGRQWITSPGDALLLSALLRPRVAPVDAGLLPIVAAVGVARAIGDAARIVWPNDILLGAHKVAGILCEMSADQEQVAWAVVGVGVNVRGAP
ncbi:MAG: biotin--[acetyl-CoA-carboxylase] ligase, partial [Miltoncostaeaceae bacterium]